MRLAPAKRLPEFAIFAALGIIVIAEDGVVLADDLVFGITDHGKKVLVHISNGAVRRELDDCIAVFDGLDVMLLAGEGFGEAVFVLAAFDHKHSESPFRKCSPMKPELRKLLGN